MSRRPADASPPAGARAPRDRISVFLRLPPLLWLTAFFLLPCGITLKISLSDPATAIPPYAPLLDGSAGVKSLSRFLAGLDLETYATLAADPLYRDAALGSLGYASAATLLLVGLGTPLAYALTRAAPRWQPALVALVVVPFWTSFLIRIYAWIAILKPEGLLNLALMRAGLAARPLAILNTDAAVMIGLVYAYLPFMVLPLYAVMGRLDPAWREAAADLGAGPARVFWSVTVPLSLPGIAAGAGLCFVPMVGEFVIPDLLGGAETLMLGRVLWSEFFSNRDWPLAAAVAIVLLAFVLGPALWLRGRTRAGEAA